MNWEQTIAEDYNISSKRVLTIWAIGQGILKNMRPKNETALTLSNTQQIEFNMYDSLGTQISFTHTETINKNQWYHVVTTYEGNGNIINIYVNGNRQEFTSTNPPRDATWQRIMMGADDLTFYFLDIIIDEPMVFNRALTPDEVRVLYNFNPEE